MKRAKVFLRVEQINPFDSTSDIVWDVDKLNILNKIYNKMLNN